MDDKREPGQPKPRRAARRAEEPRPPVGATPSDQAGGEDAVLPSGSVRIGRGFGSIFRTQPIAGMSMRVREHSGNESHAMLEDYGSKELSDREFAVRTIQRQLVADPTLTIEAVRCWSDDQLLAACRAMLSYPPLKVRINGVEQPPDPDELIPIPDPLTFAAFREAVTAGPRRSFQKVVEMANRISSLGASSIAKTLNAGVLEAIRGPQIDLPKMGFDRSIAEAFGALGKSPTLSISLPKLDDLGKLVAQGQSLSNTSAIADSLARLQETTLAAQRFAIPIEVPSPTIGPTKSEAWAIPPVVSYRPEVEAIDTLGDRVEAMAQNQAEADREQLDAMVAQAELSRAQGLALQGVIEEVKGLRNDQKWPNRAVIVAALVAGAALAVAIITAFR